MEDRQSCLSGQAGSPVLHSIPSHRTTAEPRLSSAPVFNATWLYVGAIYGAAVWIARRAGIDLPWRIAALFYLLVLVFLFGPLTSDVVNLPVDYLRTLAPWSYLTRNHRPINPEINDLVLQIVPWAHQVRESWLSGHIPLWNHLSG